MLSSSKWGNLVKSAFIVNSKYTQFLLIFCPFDPDSLDPQDFSFLDPDPQKYSDPRIRIRGAKYQQKTAKKITLKPQIWAIEKREIIKISWFLNGVKF